MLALGRRRDATGACRCGCGCTQLLTPLEAANCERCLLFHEAWRSNKPTVIAAIIGVALGVAAVAIRGLTVKPPEAWWLAAVMVVGSIVTLFALPTFLVSRYFQSDVFSTLPFAVPVIKRSRTQAPTTALRVRAPHPRWRRVAFRVDAGRQSMPLRLSRWQGDVDVELAPRRGRLQSHECAVLDAFIETIGWRQHVHVLDLIYLDGVVLTAQPAAERRALLAQVLHDLKWPVGASEALSLLPAAQPGEAALYAVDASAVWYREPEPAATAKP